MVKPEIERLLKETQFLEILLDHLHIQVQYCLKSTFHRWDFRYITFEINFGIGLPVLLNKALPRSRSVKVKPSD